jgi:hypothetical protein
MEIVGNDNRIRQLFSEFKVADGQAAPGFTAVWRCAEARVPKARRAFNFSAVAVTALLLLTLGSLGVWSMYLNRRNARSEVFAELKATDKLVVPEIRTSVDVTTPAGDEQAVRRPIRSRATRSVARNVSLLARNKKTEATTVDTWQSPTAALLTSPADDLFKSLPQLNENANELKSFLPGRANEKER